MHIYVGHDIRGLPHIGDLQPCPPSRTAAAVGKAQSVPPGLWERAGLSL